MTGFWDRLLVGPFWWDEYGRLWMGIGHGAVSLGAAGDVLQLLIYKVFHGRVLASMLAPGDGRCRRAWLNGWKWQVGSLIRTWLWHGDDW